jgi:hypothetical protein
MNNTAHMTITPEAVVRKLLTKINSTEVLSAKIGVALNQAGIDYRSGGIKLKQYLQSNIPSLRLIRKEHLDEYWGFEIADDIANNGTYSEISGVPWREFVSPAGRKEIKWDNSSASWVVHANTTHLSSGDFYVARISKNELTTLAIAFVDKNGGELDNDPDLRESIRTNSGNWFLQLKHKSPELAQTWNDFRIPALLMLLKSKLNNMTVDGKQLSPELIEIAITAMDNCRKASHAASMQLMRSGSDRSTKNLVPSKKDVSNTSQSDLRKLAILAVINMSEADLQHLWLPLGSLSKAAINKN